MTNQLGEMLREIRNPETSAARIEEIARLYNELGTREEKYKSWLRYADKDPRFQIVYAEEGKFSISPIEGIRVERNAVQSVPDDTETIIEWNGVGPETSIIGPLGSGYLAYPGYELKKYIAVLGAIQWATNGTGRRGVHLNAYDSSGAASFGTTLHSMAPTGVDVDTLPFAGGMQIPAGMDIVALKITVIQTSGGALDMGYAHACFFALR